MTTYVCVVQYGRDDPEEKHEPGYDVYLSPPWDHQRATNPSNLVPIKCQETHSQPVRYTEKLIDRDIVWDDPTNEREDG